MYTFYAGSFGHAEYSPYSGTLLFYYSQISKEIYANTWMGKKRTKRRQYNKKWLEMLKEECDDCDLKSFSAREPKRKQPPVPDPDQEAEKPLNRKLSILKDKEAGEGTQDEYESFHHIFIRLQTLLTFDHLYSELTGQVKVKVERELKI
jgi:hypothetical protein